MRYVLQITVIKPGAEEDTFTKLIQVRGTESLLSPIVRCAHAVFYGRYFNLSDPELYLTLWT